MKRGFLNGSASKESTCNAVDTGDQVRFRDRKDALEEETENHSSVLVWKISLTEELSRLQQRAGHD